MKSWIRSTDGNTDIQTDTPTHRDNRTNTLFEVLQICFLETVSNRSHTQKDIQTQGKLPGTPGSQICNKVCSAKHFHVPGTKIRKWCRHPDTELCNWPDVDGCYTQSNLPPYWGWGLEPVLLLSISRHDGLLVTNMYAIQRRGGGDIHCSHDIRQQA
jgi:hypothetical protein